MGYSARPTSTDGLTKLVYQPIHNFTVGQIIKFDLGTLLYITAIADSLVDCQGSLIVSIVIDVNNFYVTQNGYVTGLPASYSAGTQYYISPTVAGTLTDAEPTNVGQVILPCFVADTTTSGYFYTGSGTLVESSGLFTWIIVNSPTAMLVNTGYLYASSNPNNLRLPTIAAIGDIIRVANLGPNNFTITQNNGQSVVFGDDITTVDTGSIASQSVGDAIEIICTNANANFLVLSSVGNFILV